MALRRDRHLFEHRVARGFAARSANAERALGSCPGDCPPEPNNIANFSGLLVDGYVFDIDSITSQPDYDESAPGYRNDIALVHMANPRVSAYAAWIANNMP